MRENLEQQGHIANRITHIAKMPLLHPDILLCYTHVPYNQLNRALNEANITLKQNEILLKETNLLMYYTEQLFKYSELLLR